MTNKADDAALHAMGKCMDIMMATVIMEMHEESMSQAPSRFQGNDIEEHSTLRVKAKA